MIEALVTIRMLFNRTHREKSRKDMKHVKLDDFSGQLICRKHIWLLTKEGKKCNKRLIEMCEMASLTRDYEIQAVLWVKAQFCQIMGK